MITELLSTYGDTLETGRRRLISTKNLITVDAPDGSGKGGFVIALQKYISEHFCREVVTVRPTRFDQSPSAQTLGRAFSKDIVPDNSWRHNAYFMGAMAHNYKDLICPFLDKGVIVVADSSEVRALAFVLDRGDNNTVASTLRWIRSGRATNGRMAQLRILLNTDPHECLENMLARGLLDTGDPKNIAEAQRRWGCYETSITLIQHINTSVPTTWLNVPNRRYHGSDLEGHLDRLIDQEVADTLSSLLSNTANNSWPAT